MTQGWVLYDGVCGFCRRWIPFWGPMLRRHGFEIAPLQTAWVRERLGGEASDSLDDLLLLLTDGSLIRGSDVYRHLMRRIWWAWPVYVLSVTPGLRALFDTGYRAFARNRYCISHAAGLDRH